MTSPMSILHVVPLALNHSSRILPMRVGSIPAIYAFSQVFPVTSTSMNKLNECGFDFLGLRPKGKAWTILAYSNVVAGVEAVDGHTKNQSKKAGDDQKDCQKKKFKQYQL